MRFIQEKFLFTPSDLSLHLACSHLTKLNQQVAEGKRDKPFVYDRELELLRQKGQDLETQFIKQIKELGHSIFDASTYKNDSEVVVNAMQQGYDYIYQAFLSNDIWNGYADFLRKVNKPSRFGNWSYEVIDTKLASRTKAGSILQIGLYSELLMQYQKTAPDNMHIKTPHGEQTFRVADYSAYLSFMKKNLTTAVKSNEPSYPMPCQHCNICDWWEHCNTVRRNDDHLCFVADIDSVQISELESHHITTLTSLATSEHLQDIPFKKISKERLKKLRKQAKLQLLTREGHPLTIDVQDIKSNSGLSLLPEPNPFDIYVDINANQLIGKNGLCYQFSYFIQGTFHTVILKNNDEEKYRFESFIHHLTEHMNLHPEAHIYTFGSKPLMLLKKLAGLYTTKEETLDAWLRCGTFIDLGRIFKQAFILGIEHYSLSKIEPLYHYTRTLDDRTYAKSISDFEYHLQTQRADWIDASSLHVLETNHKNNLHSLAQLHQWLEQQRTFKIKNGELIERPSQDFEELPESVSEHLQRITPLYNMLMKNMPEENSARTKEQQARYILAHFLDWYRREEKSFWWEYFRLLNLQPNELLEEKQALTYLSYTEKRELINRSVIDTYRFPSQENDLRVGQQVKDELGISVGEIIAIDEKEKTLQLKKGPKTAESHPQTIIKFERFLTKDKVNAIVLLAEWIVAHSFDSPLPNYQAARSILLNETPRLTSNIKLDGDTLQQSIQWVSSLDNSYLPIQGPPGAGKSFTASRMILHLIKKGYRIGITALSHKVITNLLKKVKETADTEDYTFTTLYKSSGSKTEATFWDIPKNTNEVVARVSEYDIIAGTSFMWAHQDLEQSVDYLFVDEAGQYALIETIVVAKAAKNVILLGDHQQLKQPIQGLHPEGTEVSALEHILQGEATIPKEKGIFLEKTWRMHPDICRFDSDMFYASRLEAMPFLAHQKIVGNSSILGAGLFYKAVEHSGNTNFSTEEVDVIADLVRELTKGDVYFIDKNENKHLLQPQHIKIITPYNSQVFELEKQIPNIEIGTVDKFQGQEAPIILYSMASSSATDAPRGMDFLYSPNRFNVAVSRAQIAFVLIGNPLLFKPQCQSPEQLKLANPFCYFYEKAQLINSS